LLQDGQTLALGGMTIYRRPVAFTRALIQRADPPRNLTLLAFTGGLASDMLVGAGLVSRVRSCYFGLETFGLAPMFTALAGTPQLAVIEESEASIAAGIRAQLAQVGFMPSRAWQGTQMFTVRPDVKTIPDPYTGEPVTAFPAIPINVAVIHVLQADYSGSAILGGNPTIDADLTFAADKVILTAEEVIPVLDEKADIPGIAVDFVVAQPYGAWPTSCYPRYPIAGEQILAYIDACNQQQFTQFIAELEPPDG
jgi:glutaconate CoA-transferase subunit A